MTVNVVRAPRHLPKAASSGSLLCLLALLALAGCSSPDLEGDLKWRCESNTDCGSGFICDVAAGHCIKALNNRHGVFDDRIVFGMSASLSTGAPLADLGNAARAGVEACFAHFNSVGGVHGRKLELVAKDDAYNSTLTAKNVKELVTGDDRAVFALAGVMGTAPAIEAMKIVSAEKVMLFGPATGFEALEPDPPQRYVFNIRPRYSQETSQLTRYLLETSTIAIPEKNIAVFGQGDDDQGQLDVFGMSGFAGVAATLKGAGVDEKDIAVASYPGAQSANVSTAVSTLLRWAANSARTEGSDGRIAIGIVMVTIAEAAVPFIREFEDQIAAVRLGGSPASKYGNFSGSELAALGKVDLRLASLSTVDVRLADALKSLGTYKSKDAAGKDVTLGYGRGLIMALPMPPFDSTASGVTQYRQHMQTHRPNATVGFISLEAYFTARMLVAGLRQAGPDLTTELLIDTFEKGDDGSGFQVDFGIGTVFKFDKNNHQASQKLWGMRLSDDIAFESIGVLVE